MIIINAVLSEALPVNYRCSLRNKGRHCVEWFIANITYGKSGYAYIINDSGTMMSSWAVKTFLQEMPSCTSAGGEWYGLQFSEDGCGSIRHRRYSYEDASIFVLLPWKTRSVMALHPTFRQVFTSVEHWQNYDDYLLSLRYWYLSRFLLPASSIANPINTVVGYAATMQTGFHHDIPKKKKKKKKINAKMKSQFG
jgi:hypothetical protein